MTTYALGGLESSEKYVRLPVVTAEERDAIESPEEGMVIFNSAIDKIQVYSNGAWKTLAFE